MPCRAHSRSVPRGAGNGEADASPLMSGRGIRYRNRSIGSVLDRVSALSGQCSMGWGVSVDSCAWMVGAAPSDTTSILRGLAFSLTGIVTLSTPLL